MDLSDINALFIVIQPLSGLSSSSFLFPIHFIYGYSHLNPSDLGNCSIIVYFADNLINEYPMIKSFQKTKKRTIGAKADSY